MSARVAVIDIGSNSIKSLVAEEGPEPHTLRGLHEETLEVRISTGIGSERPVLQPGNIKAGTRAVASLLGNCRKKGPLRAVRIVATSAVRSAANGADFLTAVESATGERPVLLSGDEEAMAIALGVRTDPAIGKHLEDFTVFDLGGGSLELIRFEGEHVARHLSLPLGSVRLTERFVGNPRQALTAGEARALAGHIRESLRTSEVPLRPPLVGCGGGLNALRHLFAREKGLDIGASSPVLSGKRIQSLEAVIAAQSLEERIATGVPAGRADIFPAAMATFRLIMELAGTTEILHSFHNLRYGLAWETLCASRFQK